MTFISRLTDDLWTKYGQALEHMAVIFPTKRACLFLKRELQKIVVNIRRPIWSPKVFSIVDFITSLSHYTVPERHTLLFTLFNVYSQIVTSIKRDFEEFYFWGSMILSDFDEIDRQLVDVKSLFKTLREFRKSYEIGIDESHELYQKYVSFWGDLEVLYEQFRNELKEEGNAYLGMAYREVAEKIGHIGDFRWKKVIFAGFNALNKAEERIIKILMESGLADIYWDLDTYFTNDVHQEAGDFFRKNSKIFNMKDAKWIDGNLSQEKDITVIGVPTKVSQARTLGIALLELIDRGSQPDRTAIIMPDETMLFPVLNSLPPAIEKLNVTMGFNLKYTFIFNLVSYYLDLLSNTKITDKGVEYYYKDVKNILTHPLIHLLRWEMSDKIIDSITKKNLIFVPAKELKSCGEIHDSLFKSLFEPWKGARESTSFFLELFEEILQNKDDEAGPGLSPLGWEYIYHFYTLFNRLHSLLESPKIKIQHITTFRRLINDIIGSTSVPFSGEPLLGLQIMGMLETQALDFENLFILSMNEGIIPAGKTGFSFIPYEVRLFYNLPTHRDRDAIFAYHFYRLLKRAKKVYLFYLTQMDEFGKNEKSRFIEQILYEYREKNSAARIRSVITTLATEKKPVKPMTVPKSDRTMEKLEAIGKSGFSSSVLNNYIQCPMKFYFQNILGLKEEEELMETADRAQFGTVIHEVLEDLYTPYLHRELSDNDLDRMKSGLSIRISELYKKKLNLDDVSTGKNKLYLEVIRKLIERLLEQEKRELPFTLVSIEREITNIPFEFQSGGKDYKVNLKGLIDRIDIKENITRIVDYKTGNIVGSLCVDDFQSIVSVGDTRKEAFQLLFYLYLLLKAEAHGNDFSYVLGIYNIKRAGDGIDFIKSQKKPRIFTLKDIAEFEKALRSLFSEIFYREKPFFQTDEREQACRICSFINICGSYS